MSLDKPLVIEPALLAALLVILIGSAALWSNPRRQINRIFFSVSLHVAAWLACLYMALTGVQGLLWMRCGCMVAGLLPAHLLLLREAVSDDGINHTKSRMWIWGAVGLIMTVLPATNWFIPSHSTSENKVYGWGYFLYILLQAGGYVELCRGTILKLKKVAGVARIELQILLIGGSATAATILVLMAAGVLLRTNASIHIQPLVVLVFYSLTVTAITTHRIFDATYLLQFFLQRTLLVIVVSIAAYFCDLLFQLFIPEPLAFVLTTGVVLAFAHKLDSSLDMYYGRYPKLKQVRQAIDRLTTTGDQVSFTALAYRFEQILAVWAQCGSVYITAWDDMKSLCGHGELKIDKTTFLSIAALRWVTPERLQRERSTARNESLLRFLTENRLGGVIYCHGVTLELVVGLSVRSSRKPFTYPEVQQLQDLAIQIESSLARIHLAGKVQRAERLAAVGLLGAGIAHEIRNPLVTIKTFVQLLPSHHSDQNFRVRFLNLIASEVERIERLTEQLLNLASPRKFEPTRISLQELLNISVPLISSQATEKKVAVYMNCSTAPDFVYIDVSSFKQVFINLCINAMQAQDKQEAEKWIRIETKPLGEYVELAVTDNGPGIAPELRGKVFEAFQTTKSSGFGLGLAISSEILAGQGAKLAVDPFEHGAGATFRILFPCRPSSD